MAKTDPRKGMPDPKLSEKEFRRRFLSQFKDPAFREENEALDRLAGVAWSAYGDGRKSPLTQKAGEGYADPDYELSTDWIEARAAIVCAQDRHQSAGPRRILLINGSPRSEHSCPGEMSKTWRLVQIAHQVFDEASDVEVDLIDLSRLQSEYGRRIHPC